MQTDSPNNDNWFNFTSSATAVTQAGATNYDAVNALIGPNSGLTNTVKEGKLTLNGNDRFASRDGKYFNLVQPFQHHENVPNNVGINVYSFALKPEEHQPSGTLNMSRIDSATLSLDYVSGAGGSGKSVSIYAVNYNVLRILSGMGGIAYSN